MVERIEIMVRAGFVSATATATATLLLGPWREFEAVALSASANEELAVPFGVHGLVETRFELVSFPIPRALPRGVTRVVVPFEG